MWSTSGNTNGVRNPLYRRLDKFKIAKEEKYLEFHPYMEFQV